MTKKYIVDEKKPTEMFVESIRDGCGSSSVYCSCGRTHYAQGNLSNSDDENDYQNMLESVLEEKRCNPDGVIIHLEDDFVYAKQISNLTFVVDCPCNSLRKYEDFIWENRDVIRIYLKVRCAQEAEWAEQELVFNKVAGI